MAVTSTDSAQATPSRAMPQFGLQAMLGMTAVVAVVCTLFFSIPPVVATPLMIVLMVTLPAVLTTVLVYGRGYQRTFCLGAIFPAGIMLLCTSLMLMIHSISAYQNSVATWEGFAERVGPYYRPYVALTLGAALAVGLICVVVRWIVDRGEPS